MTSPRVVFVKTSKMREGIEPSRKRPVKSRFELCTYLQNRSFSLLKQLTECVQGVNYIARSSVSPGPGGGRHTFAAATAAELPTKTPHHCQPAELSQPGVLERKLQCSQAFWHRPQPPKAVLANPPQSSLKVNFVSAGQNRFPTRQNQANSKPCLIHLRIFQVKMEVPVPEGLS
jgi:hypothetical protein